MLVTKEQLQQAIIANLEATPRIAALWRVDDSLIKQSLSAIAAMAAMLSQQLALEFGEAHEKSRETTVLADAAIKGIVPKGLPSTVSVLAVNRNAVDYLLETSRRLLDSNGRVYEVLEPALIPAGGTLSIKLLQQASASLVIDHVVTNSKAFYKIRVAWPESGRSISGIIVKDGEGNLFSWRDRFTNVYPDEKIYHVEVDEYRNISIVFGVEGIAGYQPKNNETITIIVHETNGEISHKLGAPFALEYSYNIQDASVVFSLEAVVTGGKNPIPINELRDLIRYPALYDDNAVFLGGFDFLVRKRLPGFDFLSVWNEQIQERVRGPSLDYINRLFVSFVSDAVTEEDIRGVIAYADDSLKVSFIEPIVNPIHIKVKGDIARIHVLDSVKQQIVNALLSEYGKGSPLSKRGMELPRNKAVHAVLKAKIAAFQDSESDFTVAVSQLNSLPENYSFVTPYSVTLDIEYGNYNNSQWGR